MGKTENNQITRHGVSFQIIKALCGKVNRVMKKTRVTDILIRVFIQCPYKKEFFDKNLYKVSP